MKLVVHSRGKLNIVNLNVLYSISVVFFCKQSVRINRTDLAGEHMQMAINRGNDCERAI